MSSDFDSIETSLSSALASVDRRRFVDISPELEAFAREIMNVVRVQCHENGSLLTFDSHVDPKHGTLPIGFKWLAMRDTTVLDVPLVARLALSPEANRNAEFQELVLSRAAHRAMIFWVDTSAALERFLRDCVAQAAMFEMTMKGDRYLFAYWVGSYAPVDFMLHVIK